MLIFSALIIHSLCIFGQNEQKAVKILDEFSAKALGAPSVSMKFIIVTADHVENSSDTLTGSVILNKDKYRLNLDDNITWFDGQATWSYLSAEKEVTITKADKKDNSFQNRPSAIFTAYKKEYKERLVEERPDSYIIDLYPKDLKNELMRIRLSIGKSSLNLKSLEYKRKDGIEINLIVKEYNLSVKPESDTFTFREEKFKGVDIIDMR